MFSHHRLGRPTARDRSSTAAGDPRMGMVGGSYGGGIQLVTAAIDPRVDAIVPTISWNTLNDSLYPNQAFKTSWGTLLVLGLVEAGAQINPQIYSAILTGDLLGFLSPSRAGLAGQQWPSCSGQQRSPPRRC